MESRQERWTRRAIVGALAVLAFAAARPVMAIDEEEEEEVPLPTLAAGAVRVQLLDPVPPDTVHLPEPWLVHGETAAHAIASVSKLLAIMAILDRGLDMEGKTRIEKSDRLFTRTGARSRLRIGVEYRNSDLVVAALLSSDNRAVLALGRAVGLSRRMLTEAMKEKAAAIGLKRFDFGDPTGISHDNVVSPEGVVLMLKAALEYPLVHDITTRKTAVITPAGRKRPEEHYVNTNRLVRWGYEGILGGKTGFNKKAGHCLAFAIQVEDGRRIGIVILGEPSRGRLFRDAKALVRWVRSQARTRK